MLRGHHFRSAMPLAERFDQVGSFGMERLASAVGATVIREMKELRATDQDLLG